MRGTKNLVLILLVAILVSLNTTSISMSDPELKVYVDPPEVLGVDVGNSFDIYVTAGTEADPVEDLFLAEFKLSWDSPLLDTDVDSINLGDVAPFLDYFYVRNVNNAEGWLKVTVGRPIGVKVGLTGTVQIAKITFLVEAEGICDLHLYDTRLKDVGGVDLAHMTEDGYFNNSPHDVAITDVTASPTTVELGETVAINVTVNNQGLQPETFHVATYYRGYLALIPDGDGSFTDWEGDYTDWNDWPPGPPYDVEHFIRATSDKKYESSTIVNHTLQTWSIEKVIVNIVARNNNETSDERLFPMIYVGGEMYNGTKYTPSLVYTKYTHEWTANPRWSIPWDWSAIDELEAGVGSEQVGGEWTGELQVTVLYVEVFGSWLHVAPEKTVTDLPSRSSTIVEFSWDTTVVSRGNFTIKVEVPPVPGEVDTTDNTYVDGYVIVSIHDIGIFGVKFEPTEVSAGKFVSMSVNVTNEGNVPETFDVNMYYDSVLFKTIEDVELDAKLRTTLSYRWSTTDIPGGNYTIKAEVPPVTGEHDKDDNTKEADGKLTISSCDIEISMVTVSQNLVAIGDTVAINVTVRNRGTAKETFNVSVYYLEALNMSVSTLIENKTGIDLPANGFKILEFSWNTTGVAEDTYRIKAEVPPLPDEVETADNTFIDGLVTVLTELVHDIAVTDVSASPTEVTVGDSVFINVTVANQGSFMETFNVTAYYDDTTIDTKTMLLVRNQNKTITFTWNTTNLSQGFYTIKANATVVEEETDTADNEMFFVGTVAVLVHDIAVTDVSASSTEVTVGDSVFINVTVANQGGFIETFTLTVYVNTTLIDSRNVTLASGISTTETFTWDTGGVDPGDYTIIAEAIVDMDNDPADNTFEGDTVTVKGAASDIFLYAGVVAVVAIVIAAMLIYVFRVRKPKPT